MEDLDDRCRPEFAARQLATPRSLGLDGVWWSLPVSDMAAVGVAVVLIISRWKLLEGTEAKTADALPEE